MILLAARGCSRNEIAQLTGLSVVSVTRWCKRFQELRLQGLVDLPGRGRKPSLPAEALKRTLEQVTQPRIGQSRWSCRNMARVAGISPASVQRIWAANDIKPHLTRTFKLSNDPNFEEKFWDVIGLYLDPPDKALVLCCDEKSQVQALERTQPGGCRWHSSPPRIAPAPIAKYLIQSFRAAIDPERETAPEHLLMVYQPKSCLRWSIFVGCELTGERGRLGRLFGGACTLLIL